MDTFTLIKVFVFVVDSLGLVYLTRASLRSPRYHGFYRIFAWGAVVALVLINLDYWFVDPLAVHQVISWCLLVVSAVWVLWGVRTLAVAGRPGAGRGGAGLVGIERTTCLVTTGAYRYVRHPIYSSLLFLAWGVFWKAPSWVGAALAVTATGFVLATALVEEGENLRFFGPAYRAYTGQSKMFIPFVF